MAEYKVIQDVEAEDKLVGPLTFRQFVYALVAAGFAYLSYLLIAHGGAFLAPPFLLVAIFSGFFAFPWGRDQPTELWALAKIRFFFKPRRRIWDQSGAKELVTITAPKQVRVDYTNGLSQTEVKSRLRVLADTLDSRGWAVRNADPNSPNQVVQAIHNQQSDRLFIATPAPLPAIPADVRASDDIMDPQHNPIARQFDTMMTSSAQAHRQQIVNNLRRTPPVPPGPIPRTAPGNRWFLGRPLQPAMSTPQNTVTFNSQVVTPGAPISGLPASLTATPTPLSDAEKDLARHIKSTSATQSQTTSPVPEQLKTALPKNDDDIGVIDPDEERARHEATLRAFLGNSDDIPAAAPPVTPAPAQATPAPTPAPVTQSQNIGILDLASNNDLNVATIAREAQRRQQDEVVISLH